jgi:CRP/FNR family transcriptional regulator
MSTEIRRPLTAVERAITLRRVEAFRRVPMAQLAQVAAVAVERRVAAGEPLFREGDPAGSLYVILSGKVGLERKGRRLGEALPGDALGAWSLFEDHPRRATATALAEVRLLVIERDDFYEMLADHIEVTRSLIQHLVGRLMELTGLEDGDKT